MKGYEKYKEVGLPWLKVIPEEWELKPNKVFLKYQKNVVGKKADDYELLSLTKQGIRIKGNNDFSGKMPDNFESYQIVEKDQLVMCLFDLDISAVFSGLSNYTGKITSAYDVFNIYGANHRFVDYYFRYIFQDRKYKLYSKSVRYTITKDDFRNLKTPIPPLHEQEQIANFLDWKISEVNTLIELEKEHMNSLDELFTSKLNNIFDSIIGDNLKLRFVFTFGKGLNITKENLGKEGNKCISYGDIHGKMKFSVDSRNDELKKLSNIENVVISEFALLSKGDFIFADTSEDVLGSGDFSFVENDTEPLYAGYHTVVAKPKIEFDFKFLAYQFESNRWRTQIRKAINGIKVYSITQQILKQSEIILPKLSIQKMIVNELDDLNLKVKKYKQLSSIKIANLEELKQTLISDAVTGKIDVRDIKIPQYIHGKEED